jgi:hypothetical protein
MLSSYAHCVKAFSRARSPSEGKPLHRCGLRLFKNSDDSFRLMINDHRLANITPDDMITFVMSSEELYDTCSFALVLNLHKVLPLGLIRISHGRYRIGRGFTALPEYYGGIKFNLRSTACENPLPDMHLRVDKDARKVWLKTLKDHRKGLAVRFKLGLRGDSNGVTYFTCKEFAYWMRNGEYPDQLINFLTYAVMGRDKNYKDLMREYDNLINRWRNPLRKEFGVFEE